MIAFFTSRVSIQNRVTKWAIEAFGLENVCNRERRNQYLLEEAAELVQSSMMTREQAHKVIDYVYDRPTGEIKQEVGGVLVTLAVYCAANGIDMDEALLDEIQRVELHIDKCKEKTALKPII